MRTILTLCFILIARLSIADVVYFKNGQVYNNAETKETEHGIWIDGVLFERNLISKIEKVPVIKKAPPFQNKIQSFSKKSQPRIAPPTTGSDTSERIRARIQEEKRQAEEATDSALKRAQEEKAKGDYQKKVQSESPSMSHY